MTTYLVTGGGGFIGSHLCDRLLAEGKRVAAVDDLSTGRIANLAEARGYGAQFTFYNADLRTEGLRTVFEREQPEVVMHLGAQTSVRASVQDVAHDASLNVLGLLHLLECAAAVGTRKVVFAASGGTLYGDPRTLPVKETARRGSRPVSPYGITKKVAEDYLSFYRRYRGLDFTALALANVYGPRQDPRGEAGVVSIFGSQMLAGETPTIFGDGTQTRDYVFVDDTVHAFALAAAADRGPGMLMNIGTGVETTVTRVYQLLAELTDFRSEPMFGAEREGDIARSALDPELAANELGWEPWTAIEDGLAQTVEWLRQGVTERSASP
jgi:UDP-glucose 4-epimerase